ncbi:MAG: methyltransferase domain-containing protein [Hyphomicrobiaceae bacterium]
MHTDIRELLEFYASPLGARVRRILAHRVRAHWRNSAGRTLMGLGFATPFLGAFRGDVLRLGALMPAAQGAVIWPATGDIQTVVVNEVNLPLPDNSVDLLLVAHCLETSEAVLPMLREIWRVLAGDGRVLFIVPNRRGVWARFDRTPFGHGRPYSPAQLERLLNTAQLTPVRWDTALYIPPIESRLILRSAATIERIGARVTPVFAGLVLVEACKDMLAPIAKPARMRRLTELVPLRGAAEIGNRRMRFSAAVRRDR